MADGLAGNDVRSILQDSKGFMWFATDNGLQKYDGYSFTSYHHNPADSQSISSDNLLSILQDRQNNIWAMPFFSGFNRFDPITNKSIRISELNPENFKQLFLAKTLCLDSTGNIWLIGTTNIACYYWKTKQLVFYDHIFPKGFSPYFMAAQYDPKRNQLWLTDPNHGICLFDLALNKLFFHDDNPKNLSPLTTQLKPTNLYLDKKENLWVYGIEGHLVKYNLASNSCVSYHLPEASSLSTIMEDSRGNVWLGTERFGLIRYTPANDSFVAMPSGTISFNGPPSTSSAIRCLCEDKEGDIWVGTDKGIGIFNPYKQQFQFLKNNPVEKFAAAGYETMDFLQSAGGELLVASWGGGLALFDPQLHFQRYFVHQNGIPGSLAEPGSRAWTMIDEPDGKILIGCQHGFVTAIDPASKSLVNFHPKGLDNHTIISMRSDKQQIIWMALYSGIAKWDRKNNKAIRYRKFFPYQGIDSATATDLLPDNHGNVWVGTFGLGLQKFDLSSNRFTEIFVPEKNNNHSISSASINCIIPLNDSMMAIGTSSGGIDILNTKLKTFLSINTADGLPSNTVSALYFTPPSTLWATVGSFLCKVNLSNNRVTRFGSQDGIEQLDFSSCHRMYRLHDGRLLAGYKGGFLQFCPDSLKAGGPPSNVTITGIKVFDRQLSGDSLFEKSNTLSLSYRENFLTIQFASLSYWESNRINYYYKLQGIDNDWVNGQGQRFATYTNLRGGKYTFSVKCENSDAISSNVITTMTLIIHPPFWQTWWFEVLLVLIVAAGLYLLYRYWISQLLQLQKVRNEISKDLHDDVGSTLSSISILSQVAKDKMTEGMQEQSLTIMSKINSYSQEMVEKMGDIVWAVNASHENMGDIIRRLKNSFVETAASKGIQLQFSIDPGIEKGGFSIQVRKNVFLICKEAINNAVKYSECRNIAVNLSLLAGIMELHVADNGQGFDPDLRRNGNGLANMRARAAEMNAAINIDSGGEGTRILIRVPVPRFR